MKKSEGSIKHYLLVGLIIIIVLFGLPLFFLLGFEKKKENKKAMLEAYHEINQ